MAAGVVNSTIGRTIGQKLKLKFDELNEILYDFLSDPEKTSKEENIVNFFIKMYQSITYPYLSVIDPDNKRYPEKFKPLRNDTIKDFLLAGGFETLDTFKNRFEMVEITGFYTSTSEEVYTMFNNNKEVQFIEGKLKELNFLYMVNDLRIKPQLKIIKGFECASSSWDVISDFIYMWIPSTSGLNRCPNKNFLELLDNQINKVFLEMSDVDISLYVVSNKLWKIYPFIYDIIKAFNKPIWNKYLEDEITPSDEDPTNP